MEKTGVRGQRRADVRLGIFQRVIFPLSCGAQRFRQEIPKEPRTK